MYFFALCRASTSEWYSGTLTRAEHYIGRRGICMCTSKQANQMPLPATRIGICPLGYHKVCRAQFRGLMVEFIY